MLADELDFVLGVDTHRDEHALAVVARPSGAVVAELCVRADRDGYAAALAFARERARGVRVWAIEGTGSYGKGLLRSLLAAGERVVEVERPRRHGRQAGQKTDALDARRAARSLLAEDKPALPRAAGAREALRVSSSVRAGAVMARTSALNQLRALLVTCPEPLRAELRGLTRARLLTRCQTLDREPGDDLELAATKRALQLLATRIEALAREQRELEQTLRTLSAELAPRLQAEQGVGPIGAAQALISWSHPGRVRSEAAFARLAGTAPIPASSGKTIRHRLDRGGDRKLNTALHQIVVTRRKHDPRTIAYVERRRSQGKTDREINRCLKRYLARHLYRLLEASTAT
jgi:transposase